ncbi:amino acid ABC transporter permease [Alcaligenaceae bacterium]|uniref:amino acid ABC transporter permease n=1 Tax=Parapusillimonas sp. JC17 TaxID=3445768 RepID=UPI0015D3F4E0|nr:amino acid ABC transporter permease [Alcaligenaceae bacterium]
MSLDLAFFQRILSTLSEGLLTTLVLAALAIALSALWGVPLVMGLLSRSRLLSRLTGAYIEVVRNTPVLVQMFFIFFGSGTLGYPLSGFATGLIAMVLQNGAYIAEIYRGGIQSIPGQQAEGGLALGLTPRRAFRIVILPQALRKVIPPLSNQGILIIKDTSLVATISVAELTFHARMLADRTAAVFEIFFTLAVFYLIITAVFGGAMRLLERRIRIA